MPIFYEYSDELTHYGRLGMKWGQHIFGKDDTGSIRRKKKQKVTLKEKLRNRRERKINAARKLSAEQELERRKKILSDPKLLNKYKSEFSNEEINNAIERFRVEKNLKAVANELHSERIKEVRKGYDYTKAVVDYTATAMNAYNNIAMAYNAFSAEKEKKLPIITKDKPKEEKKEQKEEKKEQKQNN